MSAPKITAQARENLAANLDALAEAEAAVQQLMRPYDALVDRVRGIREMLLEQNGGVEIAGKCESCDRLMLVGEEGYRFEEGGVLCPLHSPSWGNWRDQLYSGGVPFEDVVHAKEAIEAYFAGGGDPDVKLPMVPL